MSLLDPGIDRLADEELAARVLAGESGLFELLVRRHNPRLFRVARSVVADDREAEDVVQDAYVAAYRHLGDFEGRSTFATWLTRITVREGLARGRRQRPHLSETPVEDVMADRRPTPEVALGDRELARLIEGALDRLPVEFRTVFVLREVQELSTAETAACLDIPEATVKTRLHRARRLLQDQLAAAVERAAPQVHAFDGARCDRLTAAVMARVLAIVGA